MANDVIYLLRIDNEEKSHYLYIKHLSRLFNLSRHVSIKKDCWCPYCEKQQESNDMADHIKKCYKLQFNDGALLKLPEKTHTWDLTITRTNWKDRLLFTLILRAHSHIQVMRIRYKSMK